MFSSSPLFSQQQCVTLLCWLCYGLLISRWVRVAPTKSQLLFSLNSLVDLEGSVAGHPKKCLQRLGIWSL